MLQRKVVGVLLTLLIFLYSSSIFAVLKLELTQGVAGAVPIAVVPFAVYGGTPSQDIANIVSNDLQNSGRFKVYGRNALAGLTPWPSRAKSVAMDYFRRLSVDNVVVGEIHALGGDRYEVVFQLLDAFRGKETSTLSSAILLDKKLTASRGQLRALAHHISDLIFQQLTGIRGIFSTKLAYVLVQRHPGSAPQYILEVADEDGYNPRQLLISPEPIMSPAWSPNGRQIAYVSFENRRAAIYVQDIGSGNRHLVSHAPGINGAPAWSKNGRELALVLSKSGSPNIYTMDIATGRLMPLTQDWYINTEPSWSPDSHSLLFTSNRGGGPQVYQINLATRAVSRVTYEGDYNARPAFSYDGKQVVLIHRASGVYSIATLDLDTNTMTVLTRGGGDSSSPSMAPNGSMVLYDTVQGGQNVLAMVSADGRVQLFLPARNGDAQDPAWSPFIS